MRVCLRSILWTAAVFWFAFGSVPLTSAQCLCPWQGDLDDNGSFDSVDRGLLTEMVIYGGVDNSQSNHPDCPASRADIDANGLLDIRDMVLIYDFLFGGGPAPLDPCTCGFPCTASPGAGTGSVVVESKTVGIGMRDSVGVFLSNSTTAEALMIPLVVRQINIYPTDLIFQMRTGGRLNVEIAGTPFLSVFYGYDLMDGGCAGGPGTGFGSVTADFTFSSDPPLAGSSPDGLRYAFFTSVLGGHQLSAGSDGAIPSLDIVFTAPVTTGMFEIDTACNNPDNHLAFIEAGSHGEVIPSFTKGIITVDDCLCPYPCDFNSDLVLDAVDLNGMIDALFFGGPNPQDPLCPSTRADFDNDTNADAVDLNLLIDHLFFGGEGPCDECNPVQGTCAP